MIAIKPGALMSQNRLISASIILDVHTNTVKRKSLKNLAILRFF